MSTMKTNRVKKNREIKNTWIEVLGGANQFDRDFRNGVLKYAKENGFKRVRLTDENEFARIWENHPAGLDDFAIVGHMWNEGVLRAIIARGVPCVLTNSFDFALESFYGDENVVRCATDNEGIGRMAAEYLLGFYRFSRYAFVGVSDDPAWQGWSSLRHQAFAKALMAKGYTSLSYDMKPSGRSPDEVLHLFADWISTLPKPLAIFACNDEVARDVVMACDIARITVPDDVAILGVDNDETVCNTAALGISSIALQTDRLGYEALFMLERMLCGEKLDGRTILCPPSHVVERQTTRTSPLQDVFVARAVDYIARNADSKMEVADVAVFCGVSRRFIEKRFKSLTGRTILENIHQKRLEHVKSLLRDTDAPISVIGFKAGFENIPSLCALFKSTFGMSMREFRRSSVRKASEQETVTVPRSKFLVDLAPPVCARIEPYGKSNP